MHTISEAIVIMLKIFSTESNLDRGASVSPVLKILQLEKVFVAVKEEDAFGIVICWTKGSSQNVRVKVKQNFKNYCSITKGLCFPIASSVCN